MAFVSHSLKFARKQPLGCLVASIVSFVMVSVALLGVAFSIYAMAAVGLIKSAIQNETGFYASSDSIFINLFTGECSIRNFRLDNPSIYTEHFEKAGNTSDAFAKVKKLNLNISPLKLLAGRLEVSQIEMLGVQLCCVRLNNSTYNLAEFLNGAKKLIEIQDDGGEKVLKNFDVLLTNVAYRDLSSQLDMITSDKKCDIKIQMRDISDFNVFALSLCKKFDDSDLAFVSRGIKAVMEQ